MLDVSVAHPFEACVDFALRFRRYLAERDSAAAEALVDVNETGASFAAELEYEGRALSARFVLRRVGDKLEVRLTGAVPN